MSTLCVLPHYNLSEAYDDEWLFSPYHHADHTRFLSILFFFWSCYACTIVTIQSYGYNSRLRLCRMLHWGYKYARLQWLVLLRWRNDDREMRRCLFGLRVVRCWVRARSNYSIRSVYIMFLLTFLSATVAVLLIQEASRCKKPTVIFHVLAMPPKSVDLVAISQPTRKPASSHLHRLLLQYMVLLAATLKQQLVVLSLAPHSPTMLWLWNCVRRNVLVLLCLE
jgi:hypothetical protein